MARSVAAWSIPALLYHLNDGLLDGMFATDKTLLLTISND